MTERLICLKKGCRNPRIFDPSLYDLHDECRNKRYQTYKVSVNPTMKNLLNHDLTVDGIFNEFVPKWLKKLKDFEIRVVEIIQMFRQ
jgi:hypothetical protein